MSKTSVVYATIAIMIICVILVPLIAYLFGSWTAYWGHALLAIVFAVIAVFLRTKYYWEED